MVLALGIPRTFAHRDLIVTMTFDVVVASILAQGLTMGALLRRLGLVTSNATDSQYALELARQRGVRAALDALDSISREGGLSPQSIESARDRYDARLRESAARVAAMHLEDEALQRAEHHALALKLAVAEKDALQRALRAGDVPSEAAEELLKEVDARIVAIEDEARGR